MALVAGENVVVTLLALTRVIELPVRRPSTKLSAFAVDPAKLVNVATSRDIGTDPAFDPGAAVTEPTVIITPAVIKAVSSEAMGRFMAGSLRNCLVSSLSAK